MTSPVKADIKPDAPDDPIVGHKTFHDENGYRHEPLRQSEADTLMALADAQRDKRAADMPDEKAAINAMSEAHCRLRELGWDYAIYCPKDGTVFDAIEPGSSGIHDCMYMGEWPEGGWWILDEGDMWPSRPCLYRLKAQFPSAERGTE